MVLNLIIFIFLFKKYLSIYLSIYLERDREGNGRREEEKHQCVIVSQEPPMGDMVCNPVMCPDWELNQQPFDSQAGTQSTVPHQPGPFAFAYLDGTPKF